MYSEMLHEGEPAGKNTVEDWSNTLVMIKHSQR
jgi:hypothetical protein